MSYPFLTFGTRQIIGTEYRCVGGPAGGHTATLKLGQDPGSLMVDVQDYTVNPTGNPSARKLASWPGTYAITHHDDGPDTLEWSENA